MMIPLSGRCALKIDQSIPNLPRRELSTDYSSIAVIYQAMGELTKAYKMLTKAIEIDEKDENDSEFIMNLWVTVQGYV